MVMPPIPAPMMKTDGPSPAEIFSVRVLDIFGAVESGVRVESNRQIAKEGEESGVREEDETGLRGRWGQAI